MTVPATVQPGDPHAHREQDALDAAGRLPADYHLPLLGLNQLETEALIHAALFWYVGEGGMDGEKYEALQTALVKIYPKRDPEAQP